MKMHLRPSFRVLTSFYISDTKLFQVIVLGNEEASDIWLIIAIFLIMHVNQQKVVTSITSPMFKLIQLLVAILCAYDTKLCVLNSWS